NSKLTNANLSGANFMWSDLRNCDLSGAKFRKTVFVEAKLQGAKLDSLENKSIYLKFAKME
ncbi:MAG: pentapeptide repeat-containing protein, partial [Nitrososphaeraceae archaeon]|nr:pentapeptide repeat-containing protein [Nitrososphaeraceae archaeon]